MKPSLFTSKPTTFLRSSQEPSISQLDIEHLIQFTIRTQTEPLNENQKDQLINAFKANKSLNELAVMLNEFMAIKTNFADRAGLSNKQFDRLRNLVEEKKHLKELHEKDKYNLSINKSIIANAKKSQALEHILAWWTSATHQLNTTNMWENIHHTCLLESKKRGEPESTLKNRLREINSLKSEWESYSFYASYSSENLLHFYRQYVSITEERISSELSSKHKLPLAISRYLENILSQIRELKRQVIYSMLFRLRCTEYYNDIKCDDLLAYTCDRIEQCANIKLNKIGKIPARRRSLAPSLLQEFTQCIEAYYEENPDEKLVQSMLSQCRIKNPPLKWSVLGDAAIHPVIAYFGNTYPALLEEAHAHDQLTREILCSDSIKDNLFILNILKNNLKYALSAYQAIPNNIYSATENPIALLLDEQQKKYGYLLKEIRIKISIEIEATMASILDCLFDGTGIDSETIDIAIVKIKKASLFSKKYLNEDYFSSGDIFIALANRIKVMTAQQHELTPLHCLEIVKLLTKFNPHMNPEQEKKLDDTVKKLPKEVRQLSTAKQADALHLIVNCLETPLITEQNLPIALLRHKEIARNYHEKWIDSIVYTDNSTLQNDRLNIIALYIKNVLLKVTCLSSSIDLDNFDHNNIFYLLTDAAKRQSQTAKESHLYFIKNDIEKNIMEKLNDSFLIKQHLYQEKTGRIDLIKLANLLERINLFFLHPENKTTLLQATTQACYALLKTYCINIIERDSAPDMAYLKALIALLGESTLSKLRRDKEIKEVIERYARTYNGYSNHLAAFLISLIPAHEASLYRYAEERLKHIKSSMTASEEDYAFFFYFCSEPKIAFLFNHYKELIQKSIQRPAIDATPFWDKNLARLIELFCDKDIILNYRQKRILEFLNRAETPMSDEESKLLFSEFLSTINHTRFIHNNKINAILPKKSLGLRNKIKYATTNYPWSLLLEQIILYCGTKKQRWQLHYQYLNHQLTHAIDFSNQWLGETFNKTLETESTNENNIFFLDFFGEKNIKKICDRVNLIADMINQENFNFCSESPSEEHVKRLKQLIQSIKPLSQFYRLYGNRLSTKELFENMDAIEKKIAFHAKLSRIIIETSNNYPVTNENLRLHTLILAIIQSIEKFSCAEMQSENNINRHVAYLNNVILVDLENYMLTYKSQLNFHVLSSITNLLFHLTSDDLKKRLFTANRSQFDENPYWLQLVNHLSDNHVITTIEGDLKKRPHQNISDDFFQVLSFAKHLNHIRFFSNQRMKLTLLTEAGIKLPETETINIAYLIKTDIIKKADLIKLWSAALQKLQKDFLPIETRSHYIYFLLKFLTRISDAILRQAKDDPVLLNNFINTLKPIPTIQADIKASLKEEGETTNIKNTSSIWAPISEKETMQSLLMTIIDKTLALQLMHKIEKYILHKTSPAKLQHFRNIGNDVRFNAIADRVTLNPQEIEMTFGLKREVDALKMMALMKIYAKISSIQQKGHPTPSLLALLDNCVKEMEENDALKTSKHFPALLHELRILGEKYFSQKNDRDFLREPSSKRYSLNG